jgi:hypothetical protein
MKALQALLVGIAFAMGVVLIFDGGVWQQPVGAGLLFAAISEIAWLLYTICENNGAVWASRNGR